MLYGCILCAPLPRLAHVLPLLEKDINNENDVISKIPMVLRETRTA
jgi:hypothetical protein